MAKTEDFADPHADAVPESPAEASQNRSVKVMNSVSKNEKFCTKTRSFALKMRDFAAPRPRSTLKQAATTGAF